MEQDDQHKADNQYLHDEWQTPLSSDWSSRRQTWSNIGQCSLPTSMWSSWVKPMGTSMRGKPKGDFFFSSSLIRESFNCVINKIKQWSWALVHKPKQWDIVQFDFNYYLFDTNFKISILKCWFYVVCGLTLSEKKNFLRNYFISYTTPNRDLTFKVLSKKYCFFFFLVDN